MTFKIRGHTFHPLNLAMFAASVVWLAFQFLVPLESRPPILNEAFLLVLGAWVTSKSIEQNRVEEKREQRAIDTREKVAVLEQHIDVATQAEGDRIVAEASRVDAEDERVDAESGRADARTIAEGARVEAEEHRVDAEQLREEKDQGR